MLSGVLRGGDVSRIAVGDRVAPIFYPDWLEGPPAPYKLGHALGGTAADGVLAEYVITHEQSVVKIPDDLSDVEEATLPCAAVTAWHAVVGRGRMLPGQTVVTTGTGGVSMFALQFARLMGLRVIIKSSSNRKLERSIGLSARPSFGKHSSISPVRNTSAGFACACCALSPSGCRHPR